MNEEIKSIIFWAIIGVYAFFGLLMVGLGALKNRKFNWQYAVAKIGTAILSAIASIFAAKGIIALLGGLLSSVVKAFLDKEMSLAFDQLGGGDWINAVFIFLLSPVVYLILYFPIKAILNAISRGIFKACKFDIKKSDGLRFPVRILCGAVSGFIVFVAFFAPLTGLLHTAGDILYTLAVEEGASSGTVVYDEIKAIEEAIGHNPAVSVVNYSGAGLIYNELTTASVKGTHISMTAELKSITAAFDSVSVLTDNSSGFSAEKKSEKILWMSEELKKSNAIPLATAQIIPEVTGVWLEGDEFFGISCPGADSDFEPIITSVLRSFSVSTPETISEDITTVSRMIAVLARYSIFDGGDNLEQKVTDFMANEDAVSELVYEILDNTRFAPVVNTLLNYGIETVANTFGIPKNKDELYDEMIRKIQAAVYDAESLPPVEAVGFLAVEIRKAYSDAGVSLPKGAEHCIAIDIISSGCSASEIPAFMASKNNPTTYAQTLKAGSDAEAYKEKILEKLSTFDGSDEEKGILADKVASILAKSEGDPEATLEITPENVKENTVLVTLEDMRIDIKDVTDKESEAKTISKIVSSAFGLTDGADMESLGELLDALSESELIGGEDVSKPITGILQSSTVRETLGITTESATNIADSINNGTKNGDSYADQLKTMENMANVITKDEVTKEDVSELVNGMTSTSAETLKELMSPEMLENKGVSEQSSSVVSEMFGEMFDGLTELNESNADQETKDKEAEAVVKVMDVFTADSTSFDEGFFGEGDEREDNINDYIDTVADSNVISNVIVNSVYNGTDEPSTDPLGLGAQLPEDERNMIVSKLDSLYKEKIASAVSAKESEQLVISMAAFFNIDVQIVDGSVVLK